MNDHSPVTIARRHDLDALRATAMLLGIVLHASLSISAVPIWPVQDTRQHEVFGLILSSLHGFRMPLFFLISGFFTAMLWRKRGIKSLLWHRFRRIFLPLLLGGFTITPAMFVISAIAVQSGIEKTQSESGPLYADMGQEEVDIWAAVKTGDLEVLNRILPGGADLKIQDTGSGQTLMNMAAIFGQTEAIALLVDNGIDVDMKGTDGSTALHSAAFLGHAETAELLLQRGADVHVKNMHGHTPMGSLSVDWGTTQYIASLLDVEFDLPKVEAGRKAVAELLREMGASDEPAIRGLVYTLLFEFPIFNHLWFLWFLCWLVAGFVVYAAVAGRLGWQGSSGSWLLSPMRYLWLIPLTLVAQWFMFMPGFGPDTSIGLIPLPHVLAFYAIFFGFGALYFDADDHSGQVGKRYWITLPVALFVVFPIGLALVAGGIGAQEWIHPTIHRLISAVLQVSYAWLMTFGCMGLFRKLLSGENRTIRYLSDSSYWLYVTHLPLVIAVQLVIRDWQIPAIVKLILICAIVCGLLLIAYQIMVRYTWLGRLLNGPRVRPAKTPSA